MMRRVMLLVSLCCGLLSFRTSAGALPTVETPLSYRPGAVLVRFDDRVTSREQAAWLAVERLTIESSIPELSTVSVSVPPGDEAATITALLRTPGVISAELDYRAQAALTPNDPGLPQQWSLAQVRAFEAWEVTTGAAGVVIAAIDSGINLTHPDLAAKVWTNAGEIPGNGLDDDHNGKIDDVHGWRFYHSFVNGGYVPAEDGWVADDYGHGTHIAGITAAATDNATGVAGLAWASPVMPVKVLDEFGYAWYSDIAAGIVYAADNGARVINLSLGGKDASAVLCAAAAYAYDRGSLLTASTGNAGAATVFYPAACDHVLAVAATDRTDQRAGFSNFGAQVSLAAPGVDVYSTWYATGTGTSTYLSRSGTSQAAPHVAGVAALIWARWPAWTPEQVMRQLIATAVDVAAPGWDASTGWGRIDAAAAVASANAPADLTISVGTLPDRVVVGNPLTTTIVISNAGPGLATSVTLTATLPAGGAENALAAGGLSCTGAGSVLTCGARSLAAGATATVTVVAAPQTVGDGKLRTSAAVTGAQIDPHPADNAAVWMTAVQPVLSGWVFLDVNRDGQRQDWETGGVAGAWLTLEQAGRPVAQVRSAAPDGGYHFDVIATGVYSLSVSLPGGYPPTSPTTLTVAVDADLAQTVNFGARSPGPDPTATLTPTVTATRTVTPTPSSTPAQTATVVPSAEPTQTPTPQLVRRLYLPLLLSG